MASTRIIGLEGTIRALQETPKEARAVLRAVIIERTRIIGQRTRQAAPLDTGATRRAITDKPPTRSGLFGYITIDPGTFFGRQPASYLFALEYGKGPGARPFIRTTAERESGPFVAAIVASGKTLERNLENFGGRNI